MTKSPSSDLENALKLIENKHHWCRHRFDRLGLWGMRYCAYGAMYHSGASREAHEHLRQAAWVIGNAGPATINDHYGHKTTVEMFKLAIKMANHDL